MDLASFFILIWLGAIIGTAILSDRKRLNMGLWILLSVFFGPVIFILVLAIPAQKASPQQSSSSDKSTTLQSLKDELARLKNYLFRLEERISRFEKEILPPQQIEAAPEVKVEPQKPTPAKEEKKEKPLPSPAKERNLELKLGRYWLSRIGSIILVVGVAFLVTYTFKLFNAPARIISGYLIGAALFWWGIKLERKDKFRYYGRALLGGAWAITYFTTYAMYHFDASRIIHNQLIDFILLAIVVAGIILHSLKYKSSTLIAIALFMGYLTATLSDINFFTLASCALLAIAAVVIICKTGMIKLIYFGIFFTYITHLIWVTKHIDFSLIVTQKLTVSEVIFWLNSSFLFLYWLVFNTVIYHPKINDLGDEAKHLPIANFFNFFLFFFLEFGWVYKTYPAFKFQFIVGLGLIYCLLTFLSQRLKNKDFVIMNSLIALSLLTLSLPLKISKHVTTIIWLFELPIVLYAGLIFNKKSLRWFSAILSIFIIFQFMLSIFGFGGKVTLLGIPFTFLWRDIIAFIGIASMYTCYGFYRTSLVNKSKDIDQEIGNLYSLLGTIYLGIFAWKIFGARWLSQTLFAEAFVLFLAGIILSDKYFRFYGLAILFGAWFRMLFIDDYSYYGLGRWPLICGQTIISYLMYAASRIKKTKDILRNYERQWAIVIFVVATFILTFLVFKEVAGKWVSLALGIEGIILFMLGFLFKDKHFRVGGFYVFIALLARVIFVDIAGLETIYKIISFIAIGIIFLVVSFIYTKFNVLKQK